MHGSHGTRISSEWWTYSFNQSYYFFYFMLGIFDKVVKRK